MRTSAMFLILFVAGTRKVSSAEDVLTALFGNFDNVLLVDQEEVSSLGFSFPSLQTSGLIESLEKSRTKSIEEKLENLIWKKIDLETKLREAAGFGSALSIFNLMRQRLQLVKELHQVREELIGVKLEILDKKRQVAKNIVESDEPMSFDLFMQTLSMIYGEDLAAKVAHLKREALQVFEKPYLRPIITISSPDGLPSNCSVVTAIYQNFKRQNVPILKNNDFTVVTTVSGFTADSLHLGVDFFAVNYTEENPPSGRSKEDDLDNAFVSQREVIEIQMNLTQTRLQKELDDLKALTKQQKTNLSQHDTNASDEIERLENELTRKRTAINYEKTKKQMKLIAKQLERQSKFLIEVDRIEREALMKQAEVTKKIHKRQRKILDGKLEKKEEHEAGKSEETRKTADEFTSSAEVQLTNFTEISANVSQPDAPAKISPPTSGENNCTSGDFVGDGESSGTSPKLDIAAVTTVAGSESHGEEIGSLEADNLPSINFSDAESQVSSTEVDSVDTLSPTLAAGPEGIIHNPTDAPYDDARRVPLVAGLLDAQTDSTDNSDQERRTPGSGDDAGLEGMLLAEISKEEGSTGASENQTTPQIS